MILVVTGLDALALQRGHVQRILEPRLVGCGANPLLLGNGVGIALAIIDMVAQGRPWLRSNQRLARLTASASGITKGSPSSSLSSTTMLGLLDEGVRGLCDRRSALASGAPSRRESGPAPWRSSEPHLR